MIKYIKGHIGLVLEYKSDNTKMQLYRIRLANSGSIPTLPTDFSTYPRLGHDETLLRLGTYPK